MITLDLLNQISTRAKNTQWSKNAFNCSRCPKEGCPAWWKIEQKLQDNTTKEIVSKELEGCGFVLLPVFMLDVVASSYMSYDAICQKTNELDNIVKKGIVGLAKLVQLREVKILERIEDGTPTTPNI